MKDSHVFIDTNILLYAHDLEAGQKREKALVIIENLWLAPYPPAISVQVLQEFYVNLLRKKINLEIAQDVVTKYLAWEVIENSVALFNDALSLQKRYKLSYWDSLIVAAAKKAKAKEVWSEDLSHGQKVDGIKIFNPLA